MRQTDRDSETHAVGLISELQNHELKYSEEIANNFGVPYLAGNSLEDQDQIIKFIEGLLRKASL